MYFYILYIVNEKCLTSYELDSKIQIDFYSSLLELCYNILLYGGDMIENEERYNFDKSLIDIVHNILNKMPFDKYYNSLFVNKNILILLCNIIGILPIVYFIFI